MTLCAQLATALLSISIAAQTSEPADLPAALERIGAHIEQYYMRARNIGWRLDYVLANEALAARAAACTVQKDFGTSDHAPVVAVFT